MLLLHFEFSVDEVFLYAALLVDVFDGFVSQLARTGLYSVDLLFSENVLELAFDTVDCLLQLLYLSLEDGDVLIVQILVVVLHEGLQLVLGFFLLSL